MDNDIIIKYHSGPDKWKRYQFTILWWADYHPGHPQGEYRRAQRGQVFFANPQTYIDNYKSKGLTVIEEDLRNGLGN